MFGLSAILNLATLDEWCTFANEMLSRTEETVDESVSELFHQQTLKLIFVVFIGSPTETAINPHRVYILGVAP